MLQELTIENFAIISSLRLSFHEGMTALTGETGAGKSIIIDAMGLLAGGRTSSDYIRQGAERCVLEGIFERPSQEGFLALAETLGIDLEEDVLIIQRDMTRAGKNICRVNGRTITLANLRKIGEYLVDIHGQNEHQELMHADRHLHLLDEFGSAAFKKQRGRYQAAYEAYRQLEKRVQQLQENEQAVIQRVDMLHFQQEDIASAELQAGEEEQLLEERERLTNFQKIVDVLVYSYEAINGTESQGAIDAVGSAVTELESITGLGQEYATISENVHSAYYLLQEAAGELGRQLDGMELDQERLDEVNQRLDVIKQLKRKYGDSISEILTYYQRIEEELSTLDYSEGSLVKLEDTLAKQEADVNHLAVELHKARTKIAAELEQNILTELKELYMENSQFKVVFEQSSSNSRITGNGLDQVEFYISTNPGEPLKPLVKVASGGELSRVMLALKTIFSKAQGITSIVFDEVDTGVSGRVAQAIADKIYQVATNSQVLCITHLPQVAARADYQYYISKAVLDGRTETNVQQLTERERINEIARMLAGTEITPLARQHAKELLQLIKQ